VLSVEGNEKETLMLNILLIVATFPRWTGIPAWAEVGAGFCTLGKQCKQLHREISRAKVDELLRLRINFYNDNTAHDPSTRYGLFTTAIKLAY